MNRLRRRVFGAGLVLAALAATAGCSSSGGSQAAGAGFVAGNGTITVLAPGRRPQPVEFSGATLDGRTLDVTAYRGKVVVLNTWGSWCAPCRKEAPALEAASRELATKGVVFIGINTLEDDAAQARAFVRSYDITYPSLADDGGRTLLALRGVVAPKSVPTTLVLDAQGRPAVRVAGEISKATLVDLVDDVIAGTVKPGTTKVG